MITDLSMPRMDGIELTRAIRQMGDTPIIVLSVREQETMKVAALDEGADDYITKPLQHAGASGPGSSAIAKICDGSRRRRRRKLRSASFEIDTANNIACALRKQEVHLTPKEFALLQVFARNPSRVLTHRTLLKAVWGAAGQDQAGVPARAWSRNCARKVEKRRQSSLSYILNEPWVRLSIRSRPKRARTDGHYGNFLPNVFQTDFLLRSALLLKPAT